MTNWIYILKNGIFLRDAIDQDDNEKILEALKACYEEIYQALPNIYTKEDLYNDIFNIGNQLDNLDYYKDYDMTEEDCEEEINYLLDDFYNFCDSNKIWVKTYGDE